jgi:hypothetical protein
VKAGDAIFAFSATAVVRFVVSVATAAVTNVALATCVVFDPVAGVGVVGTPTKDGEVVVANLGAEEVPTNV